MRLSILILFPGVLFSFQTIGQTVNFDVSCLRFQYFLTVKQETAKRYWPGFARRELYGPMIFHTIAGEFIIEPNDKIKKRIQIENQVKCGEGLYIGKIKAKEDSGVFNMQVDYDESDSGLIYYFNPIANISDLPIAKQFVPNLKNMEQWVGMILHECFHQYQTSFDLFRDCQNRTQNIFDRDTLLAIQKKEEWFRKGIENEVRLMIRAREHSNEDSIRSLLKGFLDQRKDRYLKTKKDYGVEISALEDMLERSEGMARYMEFCMKQTIRFIPENKMLSGTDSSYHPGEYLQYEPADDPLVNGISTQYYYSTGLNLARLLDKLKIPFKEEIYLKNLSFISFIENYLKE